MNIDKLKELINEGNSQRGIAEILGCSQTSVKYWLKKYGLKTQYYRYNQEGGIGRTEKRCPKCDTVKLISEFYQRTNRDNISGYCKNCSNQHSKERLRTVKMRMIEHCGGKCSDCDLTAEDAHYSVFDFHHLNPEDKDPNFNAIKFQNWDYIVNELDKCVLLCANCHRTRHAKINGW